MKLSPKVIGPALLGVLALAGASILGVVNGVDDLREGEHLLGGLTLAVAFAPGLVTGGGLLTLFRRRATLLDDVLSRGMEMLTPDPGAAPAPLAPAASAQPPLGDREQTVLDALGPAPLGVDALAAATGLRPLALRLSLENLERRGDIRGDETSGWRRVTPAP